MKPKPKVVLTLCMYCQAVVKDGPLTGAGAASYGCCQSCWERDKPHIKKMIRLRKATKSKSA